MAPDWSEDVVAASNAALADGRAHPVGPFMIVPDTLLRKARVDGWTGAPLLEAIRPDGRATYLFRRVMEN